MLSKSPLHATKGGLVGGIYSSVRCVHWYHNYKVGGKRDAYELFNRQREFGQGEINEKDRYPHLYWNLWKGKTHLQRVVQQWGYSKDHKAEFLRREAEKLAYFMKLDDLDFLEQTRAEYNYIDDDAKNAVGYITDDEDDEIMEHSDYGKLYEDASNEYRAMILEDHCDGRPVYEWQVPYGLDEAYGYKSVSTAVDVICNEEKIENTNMKWRVHGNSAKETGVILENLNTMQQICLIDQKSASSVIKSWEPSTVVVQCGAEKLLTQMKSTLSPTNRTDVYGCSVALVWSAVLYMSPLWPCNMFLSALTATGLAGLNGTFLYRTFMHPQDQVLKSVFSAARKTKADLVLGDWLLEDYDERINQVSYFDELGENIYNTTSLAVGAAVGGGHAGGDEVVKRNVRDQQSTFDEFRRNARNLGSGTMLHQKSLPELSIDDVSTGRPNGEWMRSYRDAVNNRRLDLLAHVLNNCEGEKILMSVADVDNMKSSMVSMLLQRRLTGEISIGKPVLKYDTYYERVQVDM